MFLLVAAVYACAGNLAAQTAYVGGPLGGDFSFPDGVAVDGSGNVYAADYGKSAVYEMPRGCNSSSCVKTLGGGFYRPRGVAVDGSGNVYVADAFNNAVKEMPPGCASSSCVTTLGGGFAGPSGVAVDGSGNIYVADYEHNAVKEMPTGCNSSSCVTTLGGGFYGPFGVAVDGSSNVYVADAFNNAVKEMPAGCASSSCVTTLGGGFSGPEGVAVDGSGNVYVADTSNAAVKEMPAGCTSSTCVTALGGGFYPAGVAVDTNGNVYVGDSSDSEVKEIVRHGVNVGSVAVNAATPGTLTVTFTFISGGEIAAPAVLTQGAPGLDFTDAGTGTCTTNGTSYTYEENDTCTVNVNFNPRVAGTRYGAVVLSNSSGVPIATAYIYGTGTGPLAVFGPPALTTLNLGTQNYGVAVDSSGNLYVPSFDDNQVYEVPPGCTSNSCATALGGGFAGPLTTAVDGAGNVYVGVDNQGNSFIQEIPAGCTAAAYNNGSCTVTTLGGNFYVPYGIAVDASGNVYVPNGGVNEIPAGCTAAEFSSGACVLTMLGGDDGFTGAFGAAVDSSGNVYATGYLPNGQSPVIYEMPPGCSSLNCVTTLGGDFSFPDGVAVDGSGNVYLTDNEESVKEMPPGCASASCVTTLAGPFNYAGELAVDSSGDIYISNSGTGGIYELTRATPPTLMFGSQPVGTTSASQPVTLSNIGTTSLSLASIVPSANFGASNNCDGSVAASGSCTIDVTFSPTTTGTLKGTVKITDNTLNLAGSVQTVSLTGNGTAATVTVSPSSLTFGSQNIGTTSASQPVTLSNTGTTTLTIAGIGVSANFSETNNCGGSVGANNSCTINVTFSPTATGSLSGTLTVTDNANGVAGSTQTVSLSGTGAAGAPAVTTGASSNVTGSGASLAGTVNPNGADTKAWFQYGTSSTLSGASSTAMQDLGSGTSSVAFNASLTGLTSNTVYYFRAVASNSAGTVDGAISSFTTAGSSTTGLQFIPVTPCRVADTRNATGPFGGPEMSGGSTRSFAIPQSACNIPSTALAYSLNVTVVPSGALGYLTIWPTGETQPFVSTLNSDGRTKANAAIVPAGTNGAVSVYVKNTTQVILDIDGYFVPAGTASALAFYPLPCRVADTREATGPLGGPSVAGDTSRAFPVQSSNCNIPATAQAYSLNVTALPHGPLGYLTTWPTGETQPFVSTLNAPTGTITANAAIVRAGTGGDISVFVTNTADVVLDVNGYFAPPETGGLSLYTVTPCRAKDTRSGAGAFSGLLTVDIETSPCAPPAAAQAYVLNATVVPSRPLGYLTLWPAGEAQPYVSTLNAYDGAITSNMAIVPTLNGSIDAFAANSTNLILDISSYFAP